MNKKLYLLPLAGLLLAGCSADNLAGIEGQLPISLTAEIEDMDVSTRAATTVLNAFATDDAFYAYFPSDVRVGSATSGSSTTFTLGSNSTWSPATQPYFNAGAESATVHAYHPDVTGKRVTNTTTSFSVETDQSTDANYKKSDLMYATTTIDKGTTATATGSLTFAHRMAKIIVNATASSGISQIQAVRIVGGYRTINIATPLSCTLGTTLTDANTPSGTYISMYADGTTASATCAALLPPQTVGENAETAFLQVVTEQGTATYSLSNKTFESGKSYTYNITITAAQIGVTTDITDWDNEGTFYLANNGNASFVRLREPVDLGLSVLWSNTNIGATSETDYGLYFAWGETEGYGSDATDGRSFDWASYKWNPSGDGSTFTKYNATDGKTELDAADDAARANWGGKWRMPTQTEMRELADTRNNTNYTWTWCDGSTTKYNNSTVAGWQVTYKATNATIFLPAAGYRRTTGVYSRGSYGLYWSSTLGSDYPDNAYYLFFGSSGARVYYDNRYFGYTVRPVQSN